MNNLDFNIMPDSDLTFVMLIKLWFEVPISTFCTARVARKKVPIYRFWLWFIYL